MPAFRILNQAPQYLLADGRVNAGGSLTFYETDLTTEKSTWSDEALTVLNGATVALDAAGRTVTDVWGDGEYGVVCKDSAGVVQWTRNNVQASGSVSASIPALVSGQFLTNDGSTMQWSDVEQVPDPSGHSGDILYSDGSLPYWGAPPETPEAPEPGITVADDSATLGTSADNTKLFMLRGTGQASNTGTKSSSVAIAFDTAFDALWAVIITPMESSATPSGALPTWSVTGWTPGNASSGVTVNFNIPDDDSTSSWKLNTAIDFAFVAIGTREVAS